MAAVQAKMSRREKALLGIALAMLCAWGMKELGSAYLEHRHNLQAAIERQESVLVRLHAPSEDTGVPLQHILPERATDTPRNVRGLGTMLPLLEQLASDRVRITALNPVSSPADPNRVAVDIDCDGNIAQMVDYLLAVARDGVTFETLSLTADASRAHSLRCHATLAASRRAKAGSERVDGVQETRTSERSP